MENKLLNTAFEFPVNPDFVAIDFETANRDNVSACAVGLAFVQNGVIQATHSWYIRPPRLYFDPYFVTIHGITAEHVKDQPDFAELWHSLERHLDGRVIIAHNAEFDIGVLSRSIDHYRLRRPTFHYSCTKIIAQKTWPAWKRYNLAALAARHEFSFHHHNAEEDARVCAQIALKAMEKRKVTSLQELNDHLQITYGQFHPGGLIPMQNTLRLPEVDTLGGWAPTVHRHPEQIKRRERALALKDTVINQEQMSGVINGYEVTLDHCACIDFRERQLPCKHIYCLYHELNK